jgi:hypothetical protein
MKKTVIILSILAVLGTAGFIAVQQFKEKTRLSLQEINHQLAVMNGDAPAQDPIEFLNLEILVEKRLGDLNGDGTKDVVLITQQTKDDVYEILDGNKYDRNRRGLVIAFNENDMYHLVLKHRDCFDYYDDETYQSETVTNIEIKDKKLYVTCSYGRYGNRMYTFRYKNNDFDLIGLDCYDRQTNNNIIEITTSFNFLTQKIETTSKFYTLDWEDAGTEEIWNDFEFRKPLPKLSEMKKFDGFSGHIYEYIKMKTK